MADATPEGETGKPADPKTEATPPVTPQPTVKTEDNAVEELRKQLAQQEMRANQLANQLKSKEEAEQKAKDAELEEQNQFKSLYEQEKAKREAIEAEREQAERTAELEKSKTEILKDYSDEVKALADEVGLSLSDTDETSVNTFKEKLDKINTRVAKTGTVGANNPNLTDTKFELTGEELRQVLNEDKTGEKFHEIVMKKFPGIAAMTGKRR